MATRSILIARLLWLGAAVTAMLAGLGLVTPFDHTARTSVDNTLLVVGVVGLLIAPLLARGPFAPRGPGARAALAAYALASAAALLVTDFGSFRTGGWAVKGVGLALLGVVLGLLATGGRG